MCLASLTLVTGALQDTNAMIICTGTNAFPTKAWMRSKGSTDDNVAGGVLHVLLSSSFPVKDATASLNATGLNNLGA